MIPLHVYTVEDALAHWQAWCLRTGDCYPEGYPSQWPMDRVMLPYKVLIDESEALEQMESEREPDRLWAERVELWVQQLEPWQKIALQTHYIHWPDSMRAAWNLSDDDMRARRARRYARITGTPYSIEDYERMVGAAVAEVREAFYMFVRGV